MAGRVLYGYRRRPSGEIAVDPLPATAVSAVLMVAPLKRYGLAAAFLRTLFPQSSNAAVYRMVRSIRRHAAFYRLGIASRNRLPVSRLIIAGQPEHPHTMQAPTPTAGQGYPAPLPRSPWRGSVVCGRQPKAVRS